MVRVTVSLNDSILLKVDDEAHKHGISRSECVAKAIESYITYSNQADAYLHNAQLELNNSQTDVMQLKLQISNLDKQIIEKDKAIESVYKEVTQFKEKINQYYAEINQAKQDVSKYEMALKTKDDEINFLRGHVSQLTQTMSQQFLQPSKEEIMKKNWWQFWK
jgi:metal-responsive CopG/Arc/MetJ family transcriptional regulator